MSSIFAKNLTKWLPNQPILSTEVREEFSNIYTLLQGKLDDLNIASLSVSKVTSLQGLLDLKMNTTDNTWVNVTGKPTLPNVTYGKVSNITGVYVGPRASGMSSTQAVSGLSTTSTVLHTIGTTNYAVTVQPESGYYLTTVTRGTASFTVGFKLTDGTAVGTPSYSFTLVEFP